MTRYGRGSGNQESFQVKKVLQPGSFSYKKSVLSIAVFSSQGVSNSIGEFVHESYCEAKAPFVDGFISDSYSV